MEERQKWVLVLGESQSDLEQARIDALEFVARKTQARDDAIRQAYASGLISQADIARITGLTRGRIHQIIHGVDSSPRPD